MKGKEKREKRKERVEKWEQTRKSVYGRAKLNTGYEEPRILEFRGVGWARKAELIDDIF